MKSLTRRSVLVLAALLTIASVPAYAGKPLKIYVLSGQSNMQGKARVRTIERLPLTEDSKQMYEDMNVTDGLPSPVKDVYCVYFGGDDMRKGKPRDLSVKKGPLRPGYEGEMTENSSFGPEYTFGIYMKKHLDEPILLIKIAWGGRNLLQQFRPPSAGTYKKDGEEKDKDRHGNPIGHYYHLVIKRVNEVLADPGTYHPAYNKEDGCEIAGFVWFQGFNDLVGPYPRGKNGKDFSEYSRLMACFIRDVRKDLKAPKMPFVIGVMGIGGPIDNPKDNQYGFRQAQAAPASMPEFKGNVAAVRTGQYWDMELKRVQEKVNEAAKKKLLAEKPKLGGRALSRAIRKEAQSMAPEVLTPTELKIMQTGKSNAAYHYMGSAYTYGKIGKAFADAMMELHKAK